MLDRSDLSDLLGPPTRGKVRDVYGLPGDRLLFVASDRLSAFDVVLGCVPHKGQVLTEVSNWWFDRLEPIVAHHVVDRVDPNAVVGVRCTTLPVEVVVRGYLTGVTSTALDSTWNEMGKKAQRICAPTSMLPCPPARLA